MLLCRATLGLHAVQAAQDSAASAVALNEAGAQPEAARVGFEAAKPGLEAAATPCHIKISFNRGLWRQAGAMEATTSGWTLRTRSVHLHCRRLRTLMLLLTPTLQPGRSLRPPGWSWKPPGATSSGSCAW